MDSHASVWPLDLGRWTPTLQIQCGPSSWGDGLPRFGVTPQSGVMGLPRFGVSPRVGVMDFHASFSVTSRFGVLDCHALAGPLEFGVMDSHALNSLWHLNLGVMDTILWCGPSSWGDGLPHYSVAPRPYEVLIMIANKKCNLPFSLWRATNLLPTPLATKLKSVMPVESSYLKPTTFFPCEHNGHNGVEPTTRISKHTLADQIRFRA